MNMDNLDPPPIIEMEIAPQPIMDNLPSTTQEELGSWTQNMPTMQEYMSGKVTLRGQNTKTWSMHVLLKQHDQYPIEVTLYPENLLHPPFGTY
jgi:hypothetical protein